MSIMRIHKSKDYTVISNYHFKEKDMSLKAKGLLSLMLSLPNDWDYSIGGLCTICKENETAIRNTLKELEDFKYLIRTRKQNEKGQFEYDYHIFEKPNSDEPLEEKPYTENPHADNQGQLNTNIIYESLCLGPCDDNKDCIPFGYSFDIELARSSEGARCLLLPWENIAVKKLPLSLFVFGLLSFD